jgi:hypothetical protein
MAKVLVIELPDETDLAAVLRAVESVLGSLPDGARVFGAIREDAETVLAVFGATP